jgi:EAL domain-containing protein (putative c-di-GMP-specific phosphodiesterase class I)
VLDDLCELKKQGHSTKIAVNISSEMVGNIALPEQICERLNSKGLTVKDISIEVTEDSVLNLDASTLEVISRLRVLGFDVAIDDFGTGSSNIQTIRDFPFSELKIDRSFISDILTNMFSRETVNAAVFLAREQNMKIVAEGIEDRKTWDLIRKLGIEYAQGYFLAKPMSIDNFQGFMAKYKNGFFV